MNLLTSRHRLQRRSMRCLSLLFLGLGIVTIGVSPADAELFTLTNGGQIEGQLLNPNEKPRQQYIIKLASGGQVVLTKDQVSAVRAKSPNVLKYEALLPRMPETADGNFKMANWCRDMGGLTEQREYHLKQVIALDPNHEDARHALGYSLLNGKWVIAKEHMEQRGFVRSGGGWRTPQEVKLEKQRREAELHYKKLRQQVLMWRTWYLKGGTRGERAVESFALLKDPAAGGAIAEILEKEENKDLKLLLIETASRLQSPATLGVFIKMAIHDRDSTIRDRCLDYLERVARPAAVKGFVQGLADKDNRVVNRCGMALSQLKYEGATLALIDSLTTKHRFTINKGQGNLGAQFNRNGGGMGGLNVGGGPKIIDQEFRNQGVLSALVALHPGTNYGYDKDAWRAWYGRSKAPPQNVSFRRSP